MEIHSTSIRNAEAGLAAGRRGLCARRESAWQRVRHRRWHRGDEGSGDDAIPTPSSWGCLRGCLSPPVFSNFLLFLAGHGWHCPLRWGHRVCSSFCPEEQTLGDFFFLRNLDLRAGVAFFWVFIQLHVRNNRVPRGFGWRDVVRRSKAWGCCRVLPTWSRGVPGAGCSDLRRDCRRSRDRRQNFPLRNAAGLCPLPLLSHAEPKVCGDRVGVSRRAETPERPGTAVSLRPYGPPGTSPTPRRAGSAARPPLAASPLPSPRYDYYFKAP